MKGVLLRFSLNANNTSVTDSLDLAKQSLADVQLRSTNHNMDHPKLQTMVSIVNTWRDTSRKYTREKVYLCP